MGAAICVDEAGLSADATDDQIREKFREMKEHAQWEHGHGGYTGTIAEARGLEIRRDLKFASFEQAHRRISVYAAKWGPTVAIILPHPGRWHQSDEPDERKGRMEVFFAGIYSS